jgi:hypothetical protein
MQVAAQTVGLDLVPVVPMQGPMGVLTYLDFVYGGAPSFSPKVARTLLTYYARRHGGSRCVLITISMP